MARPSHGAGIGDSPLTSLARDVVPVDVPEFVFVVVGCCHKTCDYSKMQFSTIAIRSEREEEQKGTVEEFGEEQDVGAANIYVCRPYSRTGVTSFIHQVSMHDAR